MVKFGLNLEIHLQYLVQVKISNILLKSIKQKHQSVFSNNEQMTGSIIKSTFAFNQHLKYQILQFLQMFKKRGLNKPAQSTIDKQSKSQNIQAKSQKLVKTGIDLRKDIQEMESIIKTNKQLQKYYGNHSKSHQDQQDDENTQKTQNLVHKTKKINKFTSHILKNLPNKTIQKALKPDQVKIEQIQKIAQNYPLQQSKQNMQKGNCNQSNNDQPMRPVLSNYGLLDKTHFKSHHNSSYKQIEAQKGKDHQQALMDYYVKKRMQEMHKKPAPAGNTFSYPQNSDSYKAVQKPTQAWQQVLQIQKQYLTQEQKIKDYSMQEIKKKIQKLSQQTIKTQLQKRNVYLKDLLESEYERMEYASKKQLKMMKQDKDRIQKELNSKYRENGRRHHFESIKNSFF